MGLQSHLGNVKMKTLILLCLLPLFCYAGPSDRGFFSSEGCGKAKCKLGEGDCDSDDDCVRGLKCKFNWMGKDICVAGPKTKDGKASSWGAWGTCSAAKCGTSGTQTRMRSCIVPMFGGKPCPKGIKYTESKACKAPMCQWVLCGTKNCKKCTEPKCTKTPDIDLDRKKTKEELHPCPKGFKHDSFKKFPKTWPFSDKYLRICVSA